MILKEKLVVLDFDGTLYFTFDSIRAAAKASYGNLKIDALWYNSLPTRKRVDLCYLGHSKYRNRSALNKELVRCLGRFKAGADIAVITGRDLELKIPTLELVRKSGLDIRKVYFARDMARHAMVWRVKMIKKLARGYKSVELYDDRRKHIDYVMRNVTYKNKYQFYLVRGKRITAV